MIAERVVALAKIDPRGIAVIHHDAGIVGLDAVGLDPCGDRE